MDNNNFTVLINTCDKFEDCWDPFFKLFSIYWPDYKGKIYLNTEYKNYSYGNLNIISIKGCEVKRDVHKITWSECLKRALESIDNDIVVYMQEDYFLKDTVKNELVEKYAKLMRYNGDIHCIHLTDQAVIAEDKSLNYEGLYTVALKQRHRISCQAALWRKSVLLSYLRSYENAWQFEEFGSKRSAALKHNFYVVDKNWVKLNKFEIIPYVFTGIAMLTPENVHYNLSDEVVSKRQIVLDQIFEKYPQRFVNGKPKSKMPDNIVWINKPDIAKKVA
jgi:hypothetical protein